FAWINATSKIEDETYHRLNAQGMARYNALATEWDAAQIGLHEGGALLWASGRDTVARENLRKRATRLQAWGYPVTSVNPGEIVTLEPRLQHNNPLLDGAEGLFAPADRWLDTLRFTRFLLDAAHKRGADIQEYSPAIEFHFGISRS